MKIHKFSLYIVSVTTLLNLFGWLTDYVIVGINGLIAVVFVSTSWLVLRIQPEHFVKIFLLTLALGTFNLVNLFPVVFGVESTTTINNFDFHLAFNPLALILLLINVYSHRERLLEMLNPKIKEESTEEKERKLNSQINIWKRKFEKLSDEQLQGKLQNATVLDPAALEATKQILSERDLTE